MASLETHPYSTVQDGLKWVEEDRSREDIIAKILIISILVCIAS